MRAVCVCCVCADLQVWNVEEKGIYTIESFEYKTAELNIRVITWDPNNRFIFW